MSQKTITLAYLASGLVGRNASGTAQTARKILEYIILAKDKKFEVTLLLKNQNEKDIILKDSVLSQCSLVILPDVRGNYLRSSRQYYKYCRLNKRVVFDIMYFSVPRIYPFYWIFPAKYFVCTFHAAGDITVPTKNFILSKFLYNRIIKQQWKHLDLIVADSDFAVNEIHENYKIPTDKISKIYLGADNLWSKSSEPVQNLDFDRKTILILGRWQKYKNIHTILKMIKYTNNSQILACNVIVLGKKVESEIELFYDSIKGFPIDKLQIIDYLSDSQMKYLFSRVDIVIHPSVNEGFGIPAFEAFGEGAVLIVHEGTPASDYLRSFKGVLAEDLTDLIKTESVVSHALSLSRQDANIRRIYLSKMGMTWNEVGRIYMKFFSNLVLDNYNKISN